MTPQVIVRNFTCALCGAPRTTESDALVVLCRHCGAILTSSGGDGPWRDIASLHAEGVRQLVKPSQASARLMSLSLAMAGATHDRARWRAMCEEQLLLTAIVHPTLTAPLPTDPKRRAEHVRDAVVMSEIATFDPSVGALMSRYGQTCADLTRAPDPVVVARAMLEAARAYYRALVAHPELPPGALREGAEHHARELVRSGIGGYAVLLGAGVIERIRVEVLGDELRSADDLACPKCGAPLEHATDRDPARRARCRYCDAVTDVGDADAWTSARLGLFQVTLDELVRGDRLDGPTPVISAIGTFLYTGAADVSAERAVGFLARAIPWVPLEELHRGLDILTSAVADDPTKLTLLADIRALASRTWRCDPGARPAKSRGAEAHPPPTEAEEEAWIQSALAVWSYRGGSVLELLAQALGAMQVAAVHDQAAGVSPRAAMRFFARATASMPGGAIPGGFDKRAFHAALTTLRPGYDHPRVAAFISELLDLLASE